MLTAWGLVLMGLWMLVSPLVIMSADGSVWNGRVVGLMVMLLGAGMRGDRVWPRGVAIMLGAILFGSGFFHRLQNEAGPDVNALAIGTLLIVAGLGAARRPQQAPDTRPHGAR